MSGIDGWLLRGAAWAGVYALLLLQHAGLTGILLRRPVLSVGAWPQWPGWSRGMGILFALAAGAMIPLLPDQVFPFGMPALHLWGDLDGSLLLAIAAQWTATALLSLSASWRWGQDDERVAIAAARLGVQAILMLLLLSSLLMTPGAPGNQEVEIRLTAWVSARGIWLGALQPIAFLLWLVTTTPPRRDAGGRALPGGEVLRLNHALLTAIFFLGGANGPFVQTIPWLGGLYLALKADLVTILSTWLTTACPAVAWQGNLRGLQRIAIPVAVINLMLTALILTWMQTGRS